MTFSEKNTVYTLNFSYPALAKQETSRVKSTYAKRHVMELTWARVKLAASVLIVYKDWFLSTGTGDFFQWGTFIWYYFNRCVFNAFGHYAFTQHKCLVLLAPKKDERGKGQRIINTFIAHESDNKDVKNGIPVFG